MHGLENVPPDHLNAMAFIHDIAYLLFMLVLAAGLFGWGNLLARDVSISLRIVAGLALAMFLGGLANLAGLAYGLPLNLFLVAGVCLTTREVYPHIRSRMFERLRQNLRSPAVWLPVTALLAAYVVLAATVMTPSAYNYHDDLQKYFIHPVKMLATGSLYGSPLSAVGSETLGGQALLQALFVHNLGMKAINAFDSTFCLLLACALLVESAARQGRSWAGLLSSTFVLFTYPQIVNVSAVYSFVVFAVAALLIAWEISRRLDEGGNADRLAVLLGVAYTSTVVLKSTYVLFPLTHLPLFLVALKALGTPMSNVARVAVIAIVSGLASACVWLIEPAALLVEHYDGVRIPAAAHAWPDPGSVLRLFGIGSLWYGGTALQYTALVLLSAVGACLLLAARTYATRSLRAADLAVAASAALSLVSIYGFLTLVVGGGAQSFATSLRYSIPFTLSITPLVVLLTIAGLRETRKHVYFAYLGLSLVILLPQSVTTVKAWHQAVVCGSNLAFRKLACSQRYRLYNDVALGGFGARQVRKWQSLVPPGEPIVAWINYGHHLDFERNPIMEVDPVGIGGPWAHFPDARYVIVDVGGYATRPRWLLESLAQNDYSYRRGIWSDTLRFLDYLEDDVPVVAVRHDDRQVKVLEISPPARAFNERTGERRAGD